MPVNGENSREETIRGRNLNSASSPGLAPGDTLPLVSVVIPAYRCAPFIPQAVESTLTQSYPRCETIVVNDGSPDTPDLEAALAPFRDRIHYITKRTGGPSAARNRGILAAHGKYIAFLDGDDYWSPIHIAKQMNLLLRDPGLDLVYCNCVLLKDEKPFTGSFSVQPQGPHVTFDALVVEDCAIGMSTSVVSREAIVRAGLFDETFIRCEDFEMWLRMSFWGSSIAYHSDAEVFHRVWEHGLSADRLAMKKDRIRVYEKLAATLPLSPRQRSAIGKLAADTRRDCDIDILKHLLDAEDYHNALVLAGRVNARSHSWKLTVAHWGLRFAPRLFGRLHRIRSRVVQREYPRRGVIQEDLISTALAEDREQLEGISTGR